MTGRIPPPPGHAAPNPRPAKQTRRIAIPNAWIQTIRDLEPDVEERIANETDPVRRAEHETILDCCRSFRGGLVVMEGRCSVPVTNSHGKTVNCGRVLALVVDAPTGYYVGTYRQNARRHFTKASKSYLKLKYEPDDEDMAHLRSEIIAGIRPEEFAFHYSYVDRMGQAGLDHLLDNPTFCNSWTTRVAQLRDHNLIDDLDMACRGLTSLRLSAALPAEEVAWWADNINAEANSWSQRIIADSVVEDIVRYPDGHEPPILIYRAEWMHLGDTLNVSCRLHNRGTVDLGMIRADLANRKPGDPPIGFSVKCGDQEPTLVDYAVAAKRVAEAAEMHRGQADPDRLH